MNDDSATLPKKRRRASRKGSKASTAPETVRDPVVEAAAANEPAVQAILDHALHPEQAPPPADGMVPAEAPAPDVTPTKPARKRRAPRKRAKTVPAPPVEIIDETTAVQAPLETSAMEAHTSEALLADEPRVANEAVESEPVADVAEADAGKAESEYFTEQASEPDLDSPYQTQSEPESEPEPEPPTYDEPDAFVDLPPPDNRPPDDPIHDAPASVLGEPEHHHWVYLALALFLLALGFGVWGVWTTWFADSSAPRQRMAALRASSDRLSQEVATLRRSDQISREANRDLQRTLAERDEEIAGLRADIAFYERFVGATGQRRGLSVHDLRMQRQGDDAWHFLATLTQNVNRGAVNSGRLTLGIEGTRNDKMERLSWSGLRKQSTAPGLEYSFKYFQQVEGEVILPANFKPLRVTVRLVPAGGSAVEQSFPWPDTVRGGGEAGSR